MFTGIRAAVALLLVSFLGGVGLAACNDKALEVSAPAEGGARASASLTPEQAGKVLAKVGDRTITLGDYVAVIEHMDQFDRLRYQSPERRKELLTEMINIQLLADEATKRGYDKDPVAQQEIRALLRDAMLAEARKGAPAPNDISDDDAHAYFDAHRDEFRDPERRRVSVIVLKTDKAALEVLEAAKKGLTAAQWGDLVRNKSIDDAAKSNVPADLAGDLGMVAPPGDPRGDNARVPPEVRVAVFQIDKVGDVLLRAVKASDGKTYVVRFAQKADAHERTFAEAERGIKVKLAQDKMRAKEDALLAQLRIQYPVQVDDEALATVQVDLADAGAPVEVAGDAGAPATGMADASAAGIAPSSPDARAKGAADAGKRR